VRPDFPEAKCGLAGSLNAICDWRGRGGGYEDAVVDDAGNLRLAAEDKNGRSSQPFLKGWQTEMVAVCEQEVLVPYSHNIGLVSTVRQPGEWIRYAEFATSETFDEQRRDRWHAAFYDRFYTDFDRVNNRVNEGSFFIRALELFERRLQRKCYLDRYGRVHAVAEDLPPVTFTVDADAYRRPRPPASMPCPPVPPVLPFLTVCVILNAAENSR
jgi:protein O-GlcNAc transferase